MPIARRTLPGFRQESSLMAKINNTLNAVVPGSEASDSAKPHSLVALFKQQLRSFEVDTSRRDGETYVLSFQGSGKSGSSQMTPVSLFVVDGKIFVNRGESLKELRSPRDGSMQVRNLGMNEAKALLTSLSKALPHGGGDGSGRLTERRLLVEQLTAFVARKPIPAGPLREVGGGSAFGLELRGAGESKLRGDGSRADRADRAREVATASASTHGLFGGAVSEVGSHRLVDSSLEAPAASGVADQLGLVPGRVTDRLPSTDVARVVAAVRDGRRDSIDFRADRACLEAIFLTANEELRARLAELTMAYCVSIQRQVLDGIPFDLERLEREFHALARERGEGGEVSRYRFSAFLYELSVHVPSAGSESMREVRRTAQQMLLGSYADQFADFQLERVEQARI